MGNGLRYETVSAMPPALRKRVKAKGLPMPVTRKTARRPRRDEEHVEQSAFFAMLNVLRASDSTYRRAIDLTFAIPNGGARTKREGARLKREGVKAGTLDTLTSVARMQWHGLYLEFKSTDGRPSRDQVEFSSKAKAEGYAVFIVRSATRAFAIWKSYVDGTLLEELHG